jgi:microcystin degradation protein MlrC
MPRTPLVWSLVERGLRLAAPLRFGRAGGRPLRIAYGRIFHEANAYSPLLTERAAFERFHHVAGDELARAAELSGVELRSFMPHAELTGFVQAARHAGGVELVPLSSSLAVPSGPLSRACFDWVLGELVSRLEAAGPVDGVYLALHGSMQVAELEGAPEAAILGAVRAAVGPNAKLAATFDLHANLTPAVVEALDVLVAYRTNPHWDLAPSGFRAGQRLVAALRGELRPVHAWRKLPMVLGGGMTIDFLSPMRGVFRAMRKLEERPGVVSASLFMVHPYTSAERLGWAVHVTTHNDGALAERLADELADLAWAERNVEPPRFRSIDEALDEVAASPWRKLGPVTLVDTADVVGAGAPGGNTRIVEALAARDRGLAVWVPLHDPAAVAELWGAVLGETRSVTLRGTPGYEQPKVVLEATVAARAETDFGRAVRLEVASRAGRPFQVVVTDQSPLPIHPSFWSALGLSARQADAIVQKNFFHYRLFYAATSFSHLPVQSAGATDLERVRARDHGLPMHPGTRLADWREGDAVLRLRAPSARGADTVR